jgi:hypothetical protein
MAFDWKIWIKKVGLSAIAVIVAGGVTVWQNNIYWLAILPILQGIENYWKHYGDA